MKHIFFVIICLFSLLTFHFSPAYAQDAFCQPIPNKICGQTAYDTCTATCEDNKAAYYCYQKSNPNCNGTILCGSEDSRCAQATPAPTECVTNNTVCNQATYDTCTPTCEGSKAAYFCYRKDNPNCKGTILCDPENSRCAQAPKPTPIITTSPSPTPVSIPTTKPIPTPQPVTITGLTINGVEVTPQVGSQTKISLPITDLSKESDNYIQILVRYSDGTTNPFVLNFHYKPKLASELPITHITSCQQITKPGNYILDKDISRAKDPSFCFLIHNINNVNFDCNNHTLLYGDFSIRNVKNIDLKACNFISNSPDDSSLIAFHEVENGKLTSSSLQNHSVNITNSNNVQITNNQFNTATVLLFESHNSEVSKNNFTVSEDSKRFKEGSFGAYIRAERGFNNKIISNVIDGKSDGVLKNKLGFDDGIILGSEADVLIGESQDLVQNNTISNVYDCGIEGVGLVKNNTINNNKIDNTGYCGIGAWYSSSWQGNIVTDNIVNNSPSLLTFFFGTRKSGAKPSKAYFSDNIFKNNKLTNQKVAREKTGFNFEPFSTFIDYNSLFYETDEPNNAELIKHNNTFSGNDLNLQTAPYFNPGSMIVDGGNNICLQGKESDFPLKCSGTPTSSAVSRVQSLSTQDLKQRAKNTIQTILSITEDSEEQRPEINIPLPTTPSPSPTPFSSIQPSTPNPYDLNSDGDINAFDASQFLQDWRSGTKKWDFDLNGVQNSIDYALLKKGFI